MHGTSGCWSRGVSPITSYSALRRLVNPGGVTGAYAVPGRAGCVPGRPEGGRVAGPQGLHAEQERGTHEVSHVMARPGAAPAALAEQVEVVGIASSNALH